MGRTDVSELGQSLGRLGNSLFVVGTSVQVLDSYPGRQISWYFFNKAEQRDLMVDFSLFVDFQNANLV